MNFGGLFKGLRRRSDDNRAASEAPRTEAPAPAAAPVPRAASAPASHPAHQPQHQTFPAPSQLASDIDVPLQPILEKLPQDLRAKMTMRIEDLGDASLSISTEQILPQLAVGSVKITFGQLRGAAPDLFKVAEEYDSLPIILPLGILLAKMNPTLLPRHPQQRTIQVPADIKGPFGAAAEGVSFATSFMKASTSRMGESSQESQTKMIQSKSLAAPPPTFTRATPTTPAAPAITPSAPIVPSTPLPPPPVRPAMPSAPKPAVPPASLTPLPARLSPAAPPAPAAPAPATPPPAALKMPTSPAPLSPPSAPRPPAPLSPPRPAPFAPSTPAAPLAPPTQMARPVPPPAAPIVPPARPPMPPAPAAPVVPPRPAMPVPPAPVAPPAPVMPPAAKVEPPAPAPAPAPAPVMPAAPPAAVSGETISVSMADLSEKWPEPLKAEIRETNIMGASVALPVNLVEPGLKRGRVIFPWQLLRSWATPPPAGISPHDSIELELPLKVIGPLFFESRRLSRPPARVSVDRSIPNLFSGFPSAEEAPVAAPVAVTPPPEPKPAPEPPVFAAAPAASMPAPVSPAKPAAPAPVPVQPMQTSEASDTNFFIPAETLKAPAVDQSVYTRSAAPDTDFKKRLATPKEIVDRAMAIPGVAGAVIALPDGLKVASEVPAELNADAVAAFLPQIFERVAQSTRELRMGALNNLKFTVGNVPWKIFRINAVYFAAFGRAGERLPTAELAQLAAELDRKTK
jgi:predicted regulator of Ras-like GTPase activity (Roadblock/LC7/MglB family)